MIKHVLTYLSIFLIGISSFSQEPNTFLSFSAGYSKLNFPALKGDNGIRCVLQFEKKWFSFGMTGGYNFINHYELRTSQRIKIMNDKFSRFGVQGEFRLFKFNRHSFFTGFQVEKFFLLNHYFYYENFNTGQISEYSCQECPIIPGSSPLEFDFRVLYKWSLGLNLTYEYNFWDNLSASLTLAQSYAFAKERYSITGSYIPTNLWMFSPSIGLTYKLPLTKKKPAE